MCPDLEQLEGKRSYLSQRKGEDRYSSCFNMKENLVKARSVG